MKLIIDLLRFLYYLIVPVFFPGTIKSFMERAYIFSSICDCETILMLNNFGGRLRKRLTNDSNNHIEENKYSLCLNDLMS